MNIIIKTLVVVLMAAVIWHAKFRDFTESLLLIKKDQATMVLRYDDLSRRRFDSSLLCNDELLSMVDGQRIIVIYRNNWLIFPPVISQIIVEK